jgi:FMN-dependent NADH-azoreductase
MGITDVTFILAERLASGAQAQEAALSSAAGQISRAVENLKAAA